MTNLRKIFTLLLILSISAFQESAIEVQPQEVRSQNTEWNWGPNIAREQEHNVLMKDNYSMSNFEKALYHFEWLISENPKLHPSVYDTGLAIYDKLINETKDLAEIDRLTEDKDKVAKLKGKHFPKA